MKALHLGEFAFDGGPLALRVAGERSPLAAQPLVLPFAALWIASPVNVGL